MSKLILASGVIEGDKRSIGQAISLFENDQSDDARSLMSELWPHTGQAATVGITGPPGAGKSTLISGIITHLREQDKSVGVVAVDPSSQASNGALLGDRIRMSDHYTDPGVFIRSMSSRGHLGGIAEATFLGMAVLDAAGKDVVIVETVGVGQSEVEIQHLVDTTTVVLQPGSGDSIQSLKSGLMEIPDVLCLNKSDQPQAETTKRDLRTYLSASAPSPLLVTTSAYNGNGLDALWQTIQEHRDILGEDGLRQRRRSNLSHQLASMVTVRLLSATHDRFTSQADQDLINLMEDKQLDPLQAANQLLGEFSY